jgi:hypothetical protein
VCDLPPTIANRAVGEKGTTLPTLSLEGDTRIVNHGLRKTVLPSHLLNSGIQSKYIKNWVLLLSYCSRAVLQYLISGTPKFSRPYSFSSDLPLPETLIWVNGWRKRVFRTMYTSKCNYQAQHDSDLLPRCVRATTYSLPC